MYCIDVLNSGTDIWIAFLYLNVLMLYVEIIILNKILQRFP